MSVKMMFAVMQVETGNPITKLVLLKLADNANDDGECWPSHKTISRICEIDVRTSQRHIQKLVDLRLLKKQKRVGEKGNDSNLYMLTIPLESVSGTESPPPSGTESPTPPKMAAQSRYPSGTESPPPSGTESPESIRSFNQSIEPLSQSTLEEFIAHRKAIKKTMSELAIKKFKNLIAKLHEQGYDTQAMIDEAIMNGWQSVVEKPKHLRAKDFDSDFNNVIDFEQPNWMWG